MPVTKPVAVKDLGLDLKNYRALPQQSETESLQAIIAIDPDWFWAVLTSLLDDGYLPTENVIVLDKGSKHVVKEGNRRVGALKLALGLLDAKKIGVPANLEQRIAALGVAWKKANATVPCAVYPASEAKTVDRIVTLIHGKGQKAGRLNWNAVARARHNREELKQPEPALDLLEGYLEQGKNLTSAQKERWAGDYPITVLDEAMKRLSPVLGLAVKDMAKSYPTKHRAEFEGLMLDIGLGQLNFEKLRTTDFGPTYGFPAATVAKQGGGGTSGTGATGAKGAAGGTAGTGTKGAGTAGKGAKGSAKGKATAFATTDPRAVKKAMRDFKPVGKDRAKLVTLRDEAILLNIEKTPHAFCFVLRSMFELSAKAYCKDHTSTGGPSATKAGGEDRKLVDVLRDITTHLTKNKTDQAMLRVLHGAMTELANANGLLSVTSMNQLIHNPKFSVDERHICTTFANVFPLLEEMNK